MLRDCAPPQLWVLRPPVACTGCRSTSRAAKSGGCSYPSVWRSVGTRGVTGPWHTPVFHSDVWVNPGTCVSILLLLFPCGCSELNGLNYGANYLKVNVTTVMMEVFVVFSPVYHKLFREREKDHSGLIKSLMDCVSARVTKSPPVYHR